MKLLITKVQGGPRGKVAEAEFIFESGIFDGSKLTGFSVWESTKKPGEYYVRGPARSYVQDGETKYWEFVRSVDPAKPNKTIEKAIIDAFHETV